MDFIHELKIKSIPQTEFLTECSKIHIYFSEFTEKTSNQLHFIVAGYERSNDYAHKRGNRSKPNKLFIFNLKDHVRTFIVVVLGLFGAYRHSVHNATIIFRSFFHSIPQFFLFLQSI